MRALLVAALLVLAGCTGATAPGTPTGTPEPCDEYDRATADPVRDDVEPRDYPDRPANFTRESAREFAVAYEQAYKYNGLLAENTERVEVNVHESTVTETDDGYRVRIEGRWFTWAGGLPKNGSNETTTPIHGDGPYYSVGYLVTEDRLLRDEGPHDSTPAPRERGTTVECW